MSTPAVWFCELCGELVFATEHPSRCPACGALPDLLHEADSGQSILGRGHPWSEDILAGGAAAIRQEAATADLYARIASTGEHPYLRSAFKALQRVESRHASLLCAMFGIKRPRGESGVDLEGMGDLERLDLVRAREDATIALYASQLELTAGTPAQRVYRALMDIEADHNDLGDHLRGIVLAGAAAGH